MLFLRKFIFPYLLFAAISACSLENSVFPLVEKMEKGESLSSKKYTQNQYKEIIASLAEAKDKIRLVSYNVLFTKHDNRLDDVNRWPQRFPRVVSLIEEMNPDLVGVQEPQEDQVKDLLSRLSPIYGFYAKSSKEGEIDGIFYRRERFKVLESKVWYMTEHPEVPRGNTLTMVCLEDLKTGKKIAVFNTHLSFSSPEKREFEARFIMKTIAPYAEMMAVTLSGDMNLFPNIPTIQTLPFYDGDFIDQIFTKSFLKDARETALLGHFGPLSSFTNKGKDPTPFKGTGTPGVILDRIYVTNKVKVLAHAIEPATVDGHFPSDHMPIFIDFVLEN